MNKNNSKTIYLPTKIMKSLSVFACFIVLLGILVQVAQPRQDAALCHQECETSYQQCRLHCKENDHHQCKNCNRIQESCSYTCGIVSIGSGILTSNFID